MTFRIPSIKITGIIAALALGGCITTSLPYMRTETAQRLAAPAWLLKRDITANSYTLRAYERMHERLKPANIYIEGDALQFTSHGEFSLDPTPKNPLALHLASKDDADNVAYLALPCQFTDGEECDDKTLWTDGRTSEETLKALNAALDDIARRYDITGFHLIGYDNGGAIATLLAAQRHDILSLRTVAGILDSNTVRTINTLPPLTNGLNPVDVAPSLAHLPQYHFIGGEDTIVPPAIFHSYMQAIPPNTCVQSMLVQEAEHEDGWVNKWPELLKIPVTCNNGNAVNLPPVEMPTPSAHFTTLPEKPEKP